MSNPPHNPEPAATSERAASAYVLLRFSTRALILAVFALASNQGFSNTFVGMLSLATSYCLIVAMFRREAILSPVLTHFDEAAGYSLMAAVAARLA